MIKNFQAQTWCSIFLESWFIHSIRSCLRFNFEQKKRKGKDMVNGLTKLIRWSANYFLSSSFSNVGIPWHSLQEIFQQLLQHPWKEQSLMQLRRPKSRKLALLINISQRQIHYLTESEKTAICCSIISGGWCICLAEANANTKANNKTSENRRLLWIGF